MDQLTVVRRYQYGDGPFCHAIRRCLFLTVFVHELPERAIQAGADHPSEAEFGSLLAEAETFVATREGQIIGFCSIKKRDAQEAEVLHMYIDPCHSLRRIGSILAKYAEAAFLRDFPQVELLSLVTPMPRFYQDFWRRMGVWRGWAYGPSFRAGMRHCSSPREASEPRRQSDSLEFGKLTPMIGINHALRTMISGSVGPVPVGGRGVTTTSSTQSAIVQSIFNRITVSRPMTSGLVTAISADSDSLTSYVYFSLSPP